MRKLTLMFGVGGALLTAAVLSPAFVRSSDPRSQPRPLVVPIPIPASPSPLRTVGFAAPMAQVGQADPGWILSNESQTMGSGSIDVALEAGTGPAPGAPVEEGGGEPRDTPVEDPFAGIGEGHDNEPVDEFAAMSPDDRAAAIRRLLEDDDDPRDAPDDDADDANDPRDAPGEAAPPMIEYRDAEPLDEWAAMTEQERAAAIRKTLEDGAPASQSSTLRTPPPKDPRAAAYDAQVEGRFAEVEAVRQRSNPPGAPIDPSGIAPVVTGEGRQLQELNLDPGLDAPLRDSRGTEVTRSTVLGLLLIRDMYIAMAYAMANVFDAIREGDLAYKRERTAAMYRASLEYQRVWSEADAARVAFESERDAPRNLMSAEEVQQLNARLDQLRGSAESAGRALVQATDRIQQTFPEIFVTVDGVPLWKAMYDAPGGEGVQAGLERVQLYNAYLTRGAADLRSRAAVAQGHDTMDELMEYGRPEYANMRTRVRVDGRAVGSDRADLLMNQVEAVRKAYDIHSAVDAGWTKVVLALTPVGAIAGGWFFLPFSAVAYTCLGASVVTAVIEGNELVVRYEEAVALEQAGPIVGWRHVVSALDRQRAATGGFVLAVLGVGVDAAVVRSIRIVGPGQCSGTGIPAVQQTGDVADAARAAEAARTMGLRPDDIAHWRGVEAEAIERARGYGVVMEDATDVKLARMDEAVQAAEKAGIPRAVIDDGLNRIRDTRVSVANDLERQAGALTPFDHAIRDFRLRMVIAEAMQKELTIISRIEDSEYLSRLGGSRAKIQILEPIDLNRMLAKAAFDRGAGSVTYTSQEADLARQILNEADATRLYVFDPQQVEGGLYRLVHPEDLENLRRIFGADAARPATILDVPPAGRPPDPPPRQIDPAAGSHLDMLRPQTQVLRADEIGEYPLDAPTVRFPVDEDRTPTQVLRLDEIGEYPLDAPTVRFPSRAMDDADRTPTQILQPGEVEAGFREAEAARLGAADDAADAARASGACPTIGPCGRNEIIPHSADPPGFIRWFYGAGTRAADAYEMVVRGLGAENVDGIAGGFAEGRARVWSWPEGTSYLDAKRMDKFGGQLYDPEIVARMPPDAARAYAKARELGAERLPSDLDIPVDDAIDAGRLNDLGREIYDETGVLIEFTQSRIRGAGQANPSAAATPRPPDTPPPGPAPAPGAPVSQAPPSIIDPRSATAAATLGGPSGRGGTNAPIEVVVLSTAGSTGPVMEAFFVNHGQAVRIEGEGIVLEPVANADAATLRRVEEIREAALQGKPVPPPGAGGAPGGSLEEPGIGSPVVRIVLDAYCLQAELDVPTQGMLFRIADPTRQADFPDLPAILDASRRLFEEDALDPSNDSEGYYHSIRQWALWAEEKDMDGEEFADAFVAHAEKNIIAAGQPWNAEVEEVVRDYAPGRWRDIEAVLELAGVR